MINPNFTIEVLGQSELSAYIGMPANVPDSPIDGKVYGRLNGTWIEVPSKVDFENSISNIQSEITTEVNNAVQGIIGNAPTILDTLGEIATALGNDPNLATTLTNQIATKADAQATTTALNTKAPLASPIFTGDPKAPTPATSDNDTSIATTAFVKAQSYITASALTPYLTSATAVTSYYPLNSNPSGYTNSSDVNNLISDYLGVGLTFGSGNVAYQYGNLGLISTEVQGTSNPHTTKYEIGGITSFDTANEDDFSLTNLGVSGRYHDSAHWALNGGGVSGGDSIGAPNSRTFYLNPDAVGGSGWSVSSETGINGIPFKSLSVTNNFDYQFEDSGEIITDTKTAYLNVSGENGISINFSSLNGQFQSAGILIKDGVLGLTGQLNLPADTTAVTPLSSDSSTRVATTAFVKAQNYATLASPTFTGDPKAPTPATSDNDSSIATTAFVKAQNYATLVSPTFTGDPKAPTPATSDNDSSIATTAFVKAQNYITASALTPYLTSSTASTTYYPLGSNPSGYITASALTPYLTSSTASTTYYPLGSNPSGYLTSSALTGYATQTYVTSQGYITSSALTPYLTSATASTTYYPLSSNPAGYLTSSSLTGYAQLSGASFTGKINLNAGLTTAPLNLATGVNPAGNTAGDVWIATTQLFYRDSNGTLRNTVSTNTGNTFTQPQIISQTSSSTPSLTVTQNGNGGGLVIINTGTGDSLNVSGSAVINSVRLLPTSVANPPVVSGNMSHSEYLKELLITINGVNYAIPLRVV